MYTVLSCCFTLCHHVPVALYRVLSGVFRISVRRGRGAVGVEGSGCGGGAGPAPEKKTFFCPQNDKFRRILLQFLNGTDDSHKKPWETDFTVQSRNEAYKKQYKKYPKIHGQTRGRTIAP